MKIEQIQSKLISKGFYTYFQGEDLIAGRFKGVDEGTGINILENTFTLSEFEENIVVEYGQAQLILEKLFKNESELFDFIDSNFKKTP